jgi:hypothetical protein
MLSTSFNLTPVEVIILSLSILIKAKHGLEPVAIMMFFASTVSEVRRFLQQQHE